MQFPNLNTPIQHTIKGNEWNILITQSIKS